MKRTLVIFAIAIAVISTVSSCTSSRAMGKGGCKSTSGFIGYGGR